MEIAVVGAGVGGLTTALLLAKQGHQVTIFEKEEHIGGRLTFQQNDRYKVDQGPTIVLLPDMLKSILSEAGVDPKEIDLIPCEPLYDIHYSDGSVFTKYRDLPKQIQEIEKHFPGESTQFLNYLSDMSKVFETGHEAFLSRTFSRKREFLTLENLHFLAKSKTFKTLKKFTSSYFKEPRLQDAYSLQSLYIGGSPLEVPALYGLVSYSEHAFGIWYLKGGYGSLIPILEETCRRNGVAIQVHSKVTRLLNEDEVCKGIEVNGEKRLFDAVVFNGDFPTIYPLLGKEPKKELQPSSGCVLIYLGVGKRFPEAKAHQFFMPKDFDLHMNQVFKRNELPEDPSFYVFNPVALDEDAAPQGESVLYFLIPVPSGDTINWSREAEPFVEKVLQAAEERGFAGLRDEIKWKTIRTPDDAKSDGLYKGGSFGIAPILMQSGGFRPQVSPFKIKRLYSVGASIHPGGGVPIVLQGARLLSEQIKKELGT